MAWTARPTGDMTLSILDENGVKVLGVDMLKMKTMDAGDDGARLARTLNDLKLLAQAADAKDTDRLELWDASAGLSPTPWSIVVQDRKRQIQVLDASDRRIAERAYPKSITSAVFAELARRIAEAVERAEKGVRTLFPERPGGGYPLGVAEKSPDAFFSRATEKTDMKPTLTLLPVLLLAPLAAIAVANYMGLMTGSLGAEQLIGDPS